MNLIWDSMMENVASPLPLPLPTPQTTCDFKNKLDHFTFLAIKRMAYLSWYHWTYGAFLRLLWFCWSVWIPHDRSHMEETHIRWQLKLRNCHLLQAVPFSKWINDLLGHGFLFDLKTYFVYCKRDRNLLCFTRVRD